LRERGEAKRKLGQHKDAIVDFNAALAFQPSMALALAGRGAARRALRQLPEALTDFDAALKLQPHNSLFLLDRGAVRHALGQPAEALGDAEAALRLKPSFVAALQLRGEVKRKLGKHREAIVDFNSALNLEPRHVPALASRGSAKRAMGLRMEALADFDFALQIAPRNPAVFAGRGATRLELRMADAAHSDFEAALALDPGNEFAKWGRDASILQLETAGLQITLSGFQSSGLNTKFIERRRPGFAVSGYPTYWSINGTYFLFWCEKEERWKGNKWSNLQKVQQGSTAGFISAPVGADIRSATNPARGWHEYDGKSWVALPSAGVASVMSLKVNIQTVTLTGFARPALNTRYGERFKPRFLVNGHETYWSSDGQHFLYWSSKESRWKGTLATDLQRVQSGHNLGFIGAPAEEDIASPEGVRGWHEWDGVEWVYEEQAGVLTAGVLATAREVQQHHHQQQQQPQKRKANGDGRLGGGAAVAKLPRNGAAVAKSVPKVPLFSSNNGGDDDDWT